MTKKVKPRSMQCWQKLWVCLVSWSLSQNWAPTTGPKRDSTTSKSKWLPSLKTHADFPTLPSSPLTQSTTSTFTNPSKTAGTRVHAWLITSTLFPCQKENPSLLWESPSLTNSSKSETCIFTVKLNQAQSSKTKPSQSYLQEPKPSSSKSITQKTNVFPSPWLVKTSN